MLSINVSTHALVWEIVAGLWHDWSDWTLCTTTCGGGVRYRNRTCDMDSFGELTVDCEGNSDETGDCHTFSCLPLGNWQTIIASYLIS